MLPQQSDPTPFSNYKSSAEKEIEAEDEQSFLNRLTSIALDGPQGGTGQQSPRRAGESGAGKAPGDNTMLANFFSSLLKEKDHRTFTSMNLFIYDYLLLIYVPYQKIYLRKKQSSILD